MEARLLSTPQWVRPTKTCRFERQLERKAKIDLMSKRVDNVTRLYEWSGAD